MICGNTLYGVRFDMALAEKLTLTGLLARKYWNKRLVRKLLGDPDELVLRPDGSAARKYYFVNRVVIAEVTTHFLCYKKEKDEES